MDIPEQDKQALMDAFRRRSQQKEGGAAFGVYPSSGKRPEKLNVSRDVNMPAQAARGWVAGTLGLPGDIESLGRMAVNFAFGPGGVNVDETPVLPTSEFYQEYLPGRDERPAAKFASGLGALAGGAGSTKVAGAAVKGAKATGKALGPKAAEMAEGYLKKSGLAPELIAYQGSPHKFAPEPDAPFGKFKAEKIGTGEGAQAYGHGHYTAESKDVAQSYADVLASPRNRVRERRGVYIEPSPISGGKYMLATRSEIGQPRGLAADATQFIYPEKEFSSIAAAIKFAKRKGLLSRDERPKLTAINEDSKYVPVTKAADVAEPEYTQFIASDPGYLYTVDIPDEKIAQMLDWDKPLSQQPEVIKALKGTDYEVGISQKEAEKIADMRLREEADEWAEMTGGDPVDYINNADWEKYVDQVRKESGSVDSSITGQDLHRMVMRDEGYRPELFDPENYQISTSESLRGYGIPGIKYLDANSRAAGKGTRNFVIFPGEEESVKIIDRKAEGGLVQDTDAIAAKLTGMDKDKALTHALRMANAKQEAHMAAGGLAKLLKGAKAAPAAKPAQIGNYQALPLQLPRAPNLPPQELTKTAERIARQQTGQHVRKSATEAQNLAGRSMKEVERLKNLDIQIQRTKDLPTPSVVPEELGQVRIALPGDISVADQILMSVNDLPIGAPQEGGPMYGLGKMGLQDPRFWASNEGPAQIFQNKVTDLANLYETPEILAQHLAMAHDAMNFAQHFADASLRAMQQMPVHPESAREFNKIIREGYEKINPRTKERIRIGFPEFPGVENYDEAYKALKANPEMRKWFNNRMKVEKITEPLGLPSGKEIEYAIMEPELRNMEHSLTGLSVGRMKPGASLIPGSEHATYSHDIAGQALGRTKELTPLELAFPDASAYIRRTQRPQDFTGTIQKVFPHQVVDDQYINQLGEYYTRLKQIRGYKKGGAVKKSGLSVLNKAII